MIENQDDTSEAIWRQKHSNLIRLVNGEFSPIWLRVLNEIWPQKAFEIAVDQMNLTDFSAGMPKSNAANIEIPLPPCKTKNPSVAAMKSWVETYLQEDLCSVILHGSLGTDEVVNYSDFDGLVIIKDEVFADRLRLARVANRLFQARRIMYQQDPLQHHGWFVLPERAFEAWPEYYLPAIVLKNASQISRSGTQILSLKPALKTSQEIALFNQLITNIQNGIQSKNYLVNFYQFKSLISKILLLPTMYVQARDGAGVFKRESFAAAKVDFSGSQWEVIAVVSKIRSNWPKVRSTSPEFLSMRPGWVGNLWRRKRKQAIPSELLALFCKQEIEALMKLMAMMQAQLVAGNATNE